MNQEISNITPSAVYDLQQSGKEIDLVDVRTPSEFNGCHAKGARLLTLSDCDAESIEQGRRGPKNAPFYIICQSGGRSRSACERLASSGVAVVNVQGGTSAWKNAGLPIEDNGGGPGQMIRIGTIILTVTLLGVGMTVNHSFIWVACGLWIVASLLTGGCPLGACSVVPRKIR